MSGDYVLVALVGDEETRAANSLAGWLESSGNAVERFESEMPDVAAVATAVQNRPGIAVVLLGHGGHRGVGPDRARLWCDRSNVKPIFAGSRIYAIACDTVAGPDSFGHAALVAGVVVFAGHNNSIGFSQLWDLENISPRAFTTAADGVCAALRCFINGCDDAAQLKNAVYEGLRILDRGFLIDAAELPDNGDPDQTAALALERLAVSLCVLTP